jgi:GNAT superfamily N-acetyltransferase
MKTDADFLHRTAHAGDIPQLKALWRETFGDTDAYIDDFLSMWFDGELTAVAEADGRIAAAAYLLPVGHLKTPEGERTPCGMVYAVATRESQRGRGLGSRVSRELGELANSRGIPVTVLCPADDGLFEFYEKRTEYREYFTADILEYTPDREPRDAILTFERVSPGQYAAMRESFLAGVTHIEYHEKAIAYQAAICSPDGGLFRVDGGHGAGCAVLDTSPLGDVIARELLCGETDRDGAAYAILRRFGAARCTVRTPGNGSRFGMAAGAASVADAGGYSGAWYGFAFD